MNLDPVYISENTQATLLERDRVYTRVLESLHGDRFRSYRQNWVLREEKMECGDFPLSLDFSINSGCQLSCVMCPLPSTQRHKKRDNISLPIFRRIMSEAKEHNLPAMTLGLGSEPLLSKDLFLILEISGKSDVMDIRLGTNGLLLEEETIDKLLDSPLTRLEVSVDASGPTSYKNIRGGDYYSLEKKIELFLSRRCQKNQLLPLLRLSFLTLEENHGELMPFIDRWKDVCDMLSIQRPIYFEGSRLKKEKFPKNTSNFTCTQPWQRLSILEDLSIWPCCSWYGIGILNDNLLNGSVSDIWRGAKLEAFRSGLKNSVPTQNCVRCHDATFMAK